MNKYGYKYLVGKSDPDADKAVARLGPLAEKLQRRRKVDGSPFLPLQLGDIENQWNGLIDFTQGRHADMSVEAARACQEEVALVFRFRASAYMDKVRVGRQLRHVRRVAIKDIQLPTCECTGGAQHFDLCPDDALDAVKAVMQQVVDATDAEEAHNASWAADALITTLANHGIAVAWTKLWDDVCPPLLRTIPAARLAAYKAWDNKWQVVAEDMTTGELTIERSRVDRFHRAKALLSEQAAREERRPLEPPPDWEPEPETKEGA